MTITKRSLHALCMHLNSRESFLMVKFEVSNVSHGIELDNESTALRNFALTTSIQSMQRPSWVKFGPLFLKKICYLYHGTGELYPNFCKVVDLFIFNDENGIRSCVLQVLNCETQFFDSHFNAYVISTHLPQSFIKK